MAGYFEEYGVGDEKRSRVIRWIVISVAVLFFGGLIFYFTFRTWPAKHQVAAFLDELKRGDYQSAYRDWGCARPCRDYSFNSFMEDWGPQSDFRNPSAASIKRSRVCNSGVIVTLTSPNGKDVPLWYDRDSGTLGYSPWPVCVPRIPAPTAR